MPFDYKGRSLAKIGVVGSGQIGPDIALYFTKVLEPHGCKVVVVDVVPEALARGKEKLVKKIDKGVESKAFKPDQAERMKANVEFTLDYDRLGDADFVLEAATEAKEIKHKIFARLESLCGETTVFASNSSHLEPEAIFAPLQYKDRTCVIHYFFPAERNPVVEVVPGTDTDRRLADWLVGFYEAIGKVPLRVKSRYGYAIDPIFEGLFLASALCVERKLADAKQVDAIAQKALGLGVGPFTAMNLTGGNPITQTGLRHYHDVIMPWFRSPASLDERVAKKEPWPTPARGETVAYDERTYHAVSEDLVGAYLGLCAEIVDAGLVPLGDLEMAVEQALVVRPPFAWMNEIGVGAALKKVEAYARTNDGFKVPELLVRQARSGKPWEIPLVVREDRDGTAVLTIRRPKVLNALNAEVYRQLDAHVRAIEADPRVKSVVLTGHGRKAFVSGADVSMLAALKTPEDGERTSLESQSILARIENSKKPYVCAMNGLAYGGGNELAMACHARLAAAGQSNFVAQPEPKLGIIPGAGGTQRLPRLIGVAAAWPILRLGNPISSAEAAKLGLVRKEVAPDRLLDEAIALARAAAEGREKPAPIPRGPIEVPANLPELDLGGLSRAIDAIVRRAIVEGAKLPLGEGLTLEAKLFGECGRTKDMKIGMENFIQNGPRSAAPFVHA